MMNNIADLSSYFRVTLNRSKEIGRGDVPYTTQALKQDLERVRNAWHEYRSSRDRDAVYIYLSAVFGLVVWWTAARHALDYARKALRLQNISPSDRDEPFAAIIWCTTDPTNVDKRTRSKWSRVLRYALEFKSPSEPLGAFIKRKGGINKCAERSLRMVGRLRVSCSGTIRTAKTRIRAKKRVL